MIEDKVGSAETRLQMILLKSQRPGKKLNRSSLMLVLPCFCLLVSTAAVLKTAAKEPSKAPNSATSGSNSLNKNASKLRVSADQCLRLKNYQEAERLYKQAYDAGDVRAATRLGAILEEGLSGKYDLDGAEKWYLLAARAGDPEAACRLAGILDYKQPQRARDDGSKPLTSTESLKWLKVAADGGYLDAQRKLATLYSRGKPSPERQALSFKYRMMAAKQGDAKNNFKVGNYLINGIGCQKNAAAAVPYLKYAAETDPNACRLLASLYASGAPGLAQNQKEARLWQDRYRSLTKRNSQIDGEIIDSFNKKD